MERRAFMRLIGMCVLLLTASCASMTPPYVDLPDPSQSGGVSVTVDRAVRSVFGYVGLRGTVTNETDKLVKSCRITIRSYDEEMEAAPSARAVVEALHPGETRDYLAEFPKPLKLVRTVLAPRLTLTW